MRDARCEREKVAQDKSRVTSRDQLWYHVTWSWRSDTSSPHTETCTHNTSPTLCRHGEACTLNLHLLQLNAVRCLRYDIRNAGLPSWEAARARSRASTCEISVPSSVRQFCQLPLLSTCRLEDFSFGSSRIYLDQSNLLVFYGFWDEKLLFLAQKMTR